jgi:hypothetical protein
MHKVDHVDTIRFLKEEDLLDVFVVDFVVMSLPMKLGKT